MNHVSPRALAAAWLAGVLLLAARIAAARFTPSLRRPSIRRFAPIAGLVEAAIARHELPGAVVLIGRGDQVVYHQAFGDRAVLPAREPMTEDTIFDLASLTKVVATTTSVMKLVEQGRIRLNDPVAPFIPEFGQYGKARITIRQLLTHTSGLRPDLELEVEFSRRRRSDSARDRGSAGRRARRAVRLQRHQLLSARRHRPPRERRAARRYAKAHIFDPLGMTRHDVPAA